MKLTAAIVLILATTLAQAAPDWDNALTGEHRSAGNIDRNDSRHPRETLEFFGLRPEMTVVEITPGGGWYTEVLAPLMRDQGMLYAAHFGLNAGYPYYRNSLGKFLQKLAASPDVYDSVMVTQLQPPEEVVIAPVGSADMALAFRNVHSWMRAGNANAVLAAIHASLKPGGIFGVVQHRGLPGMSEEQMKETGYVTQDKVVNLVESAGFKLVDSSEVNANPSDTADHPKGVWTLPPSLRMGDTDKARYEAIGESDRMTLKFIRPES